MSVTRREFGLMVLVATSCAGASLASTRQPLVIADVGMNPLGAIGDGVDFLAVSIGLSRDGVVMACAGPELSSTTDVARHPAFADRRTTKSLEGEAVSGWFIEDFTQAELGELELVDAANPRRRDKAVLRMDTLRGMMAIARAGCVRTGRVIGIYVRARHAAHYAAAGLVLEARLADLIRLEGYNAAAAAMIIEVDDVRTLNALSRLSRARKVLAISTRSAETLTDFHSLRPAAQGLSMSEGSSSLIGAAHASGLSLFVRVPSIDRRRLEALFADGMDGVITTATATSVWARDTVMTRSPGGKT